MKKAFTLAAAAVLLFAGSAKLHAEDYYYMFVMSCGVEDFWVVEEEMDVEQILEIIDFDELRYCGNE